jgi:glycerol-3-phosphate dehydrogenase
MARDRENGTVRTAWDTSTPIRGRVLYNWPEGACEEELRLADGVPIDSEVFDVAILGAGVVGTAIAYLLSQHKLRVVLIDKEHSVGEGTSKGNSAIIHTGFDAVPGSLESELVNRASRLWPERARKLKVPIERCSAILVALDEEQEALLPKLHHKALDNGVDDVEMLSAKQVRDMEPHVTPAVRGGLFVERESIADPFTPCIACAEIAVVNGATVLLGFAVERVEADGDLKVIRGGSGRQIRSRWIINAAGLGSMKIAATYGGKAFDLNPRRGQFFIFDKISRRLVDRILLPVPTPQTKGILVCPTIFGNLLGGPTAEDLDPDAIDCTETTPDGLQLVYDGMLRLCPDLKEEPITTTYAGLRCNCAQGSFQLTCNDGMPGILTITGVRSTGLTASPSLAELVLEQMHTECGLPLERNPDAIEERPESTRPGWHSPRPQENAETLAASPDYARMICHCELISRQELVNAIASPICPRTIDALRRQTRSATGRCQGFNCLGQIADVLSTESGIALDRITKKGPGSEVFTR